MPSRAAATAFARSGRLGVTSVGGVSEMRAQRAAACTSPKAARQRATSQSGAFSVAGRSWARRAPPSRSSPRRMALISPLNLWVDGNWSARSTVVETAAKAGASPNRIWAAPRRSRARAEGGGGDVRRALSRWSIRPSPRRVVEARLRANARSDPVSWEKGGVFIASSKPPRRARAASTRDRAARRAGRPLAESSGMSIWVTDDRVPHGRGLGKARIAARVPGLWRHRRSARI